MSEKKYRQNPVIAWREIDSEAVLVDPRTGRIRVLNHTGTVVWNICGEARTMAEICALVTGEFEVSPQEALEDIRSFIEECVAKDLIHVIQA